MIFISYPHTRSPCKGAGGWYQLKRVDTTPAFIFKMITDKKSYDALVEMQREGIKKQLKHSRGKVNKEQKEKLVIEFNIRK
jgi:hypothetical protein